MDFNRLSDVKFGDREALNDFLFENEQQHLAFRIAMFQRGATPPAFPLADIDVDNIDDFLLNHQVEHQFYSNVLGLENPFNMLDADWRKENDFYDWISQHYLIHAQIAQALGISSND